MIFGDTMDETPELWKRARTVLAAGLWSPSSGIFQTPGGKLPVLIKEARGCYSTDTSGRTYIDYIMGWGTAVLGFSHPKVEAAIRDHLSKGLTLSLMHPIEIDVAERLCAMVPCAQKVAFGKNGSDVLAMAVRVARAYTGREKILFCGYHGIHDWYMAAVPRCPGIPRSLRDLILPFPYNDLNALEEILEANEGTVAGLVMEPVAETLPEPGFLEGVRKLTRRHGVVLIFDEIITGFRLARGGAQEYFQVEPDLACLAKCMANGMPLSALAGPPELAEAISAVMYGLTFRGETLSLAAARAVLDVIREEPVCEHLWSTGNTIREWMCDAAKRNGVPLSLHGPSPRMSFHMESVSGLSKKELLAYFIQECLAGGVLQNGNLLPSYAHDEAAIDASLKVFEQALQAVGRAMDRRSLDGLLHIPPVPLWVEEEEGK
jgi:glutamate-1-semialdehyde 2,1-aminomutase